MGPPLVFPSLDQRSARGVSAACESVGGCSKRLSERLQRGPRWCVQLLAGGAAATAGPLRRYVAATGHMPTAKRVSSAAVEPLRNKLCQLRMPRQLVPRSASPVGAHDMRQVPLSRRDQAGRAVRQNHVEDRQVLADQQAGAAQRHLRRRQLQVVREVCRDLQFATSTVHPLYRQRGTLLLWRALSLQHEDAMQHELASAVALAVLCTSRASMYDAALSQPFVGCVAGTSWCTPRAATCATTCRCSSASPTTTSCCPAGATSRSSPSPS